MEETTTTEYTHNTFILETVVSALDLDTTSLPFSFTAYLNDGRIVSISVNKAEIDTSVEGVT